jgi:amidase
MARSAADLMLELAVLAGPDELAEGVGYQLALPPPRRDRLAGFRALVMDAHPLCPTAASVAGALDELTERLAKLGVRIVRDSPKLPDLALTTQTYVELLAAFFAADLTTERREAVMAEARSLSADDKSIAACRVRGFTISHCDWILATRRRAALRGRWLALFEDVDVVLCPAMPTPAFPHDHTPMTKRALDIDGQNRSYFDQLTWAGPATLNGLPATTAPIGRTDTGLPIGVQIIGGFLDDRTTIAFAGMVEREFGGFTPPPML